jgi:hypothetical protein
MTLLNVRQWKQHSEDHSTHSLMKDVFSQHIFLFQQKINCLHLKWCWKSLFSLMLTIFMTSKCATCLLVYKMNSMVCTKCLLVEKQTIASYVLIWTKTHPTMIKKMNKKTGETPPEIQGKVWKTRISVIDDGRECYVDLNKRVFVGKDFLLGSQALLFVVIQ